MADDDDLVLESEWTPGAEGKGEYRLFLTNRGREPLTNIRLGFSGPARASDNTPVTGGRIVFQLSNYCEIAPDAGLSIEPGATWTIGIGQLDYPIRHWTDGVTSAFVILGDGTARPVTTVPTRLKGSDAKPRRGTMRFAVPDDSPVSVPVVPWPKSVDVSGRRTAPDGLALIADGEAAATAVSFAGLTQRLFPGEGIVRAENEGGLPVDCRITTDLEREAHEIAFAADRVAVAGGSPTGLLYGLVTLGQIQRGARLRATQFSFPTDGRISDAPQMRWRGCHLDVARRFRSREEIERFLAIMAWNKLNVFHWHLSDDEGWRVEINAYPALTAVGAWRGHGLALPPLLGTGPERSGGYYAKQEVREVIALASGLGIDVVPEIDVPGHCHALLKALPRMRDPDERAGDYRSIQAFPNNCLNPAVEAVYEVVETIFDELGDLFPSRYFHVGADEVPAEAWIHSSAANRLRAELGVTGAAPLQAHFLQRVQAFLTARGKITGAWEEAAQGGGIEKANCYLVGWHSVEASQRLAGEGYEVVVSPGQAYYLDMANGPDWHECGAAWAGWSSPEMTYAFDPAAGWSADERARLMGVQACIWAEPTTDRAVFDRLVFPRLSAIAETAWTQEGAKDYARFAALASLMPNLYGQYEEN